MKSFDNHTDGKKPERLIIGLGGAGCEIADSIFVRGLEDIEVLLIDTNEYGLKKFSSANKVHIDRDLPVDEGLEKSQKEIERYLIQKEEVIIIAGLGGGLGTDALPILAKVLKDKNITVRTTVTMPFKFEGEGVNERAQQALAKTREITDQVWAFELQSVFSEVKENTTFKEAFQIVNKRVFECITN